MSTTLSTRAFVVRTWIHNIKDQNVHIHAYIFDVVGVGIYNKNLIPWMWQERGRFVQGETGFNKSAVKIFRGGTHASQEG